MNIHRRKLGVRRREFKLLFELHGTLPLYYLARKDKGVIEALLGNLAYKIGDLFTDLRGIHKDGKFRIL